MRAPLAILIALIPICGIADSHRAEDWPEGSAMHTGRKAQDRLAEADKQLNDAYRSLLRAMPKDESDHYPRKALIAAQRAWISYRDAFCDLEGELGGGVRMWKSTFSTICLADLTEARTSQLREMLSRVRP